MQSSYECLRESFAEVEVRPISSLPDRQRYTVRLVFGRNGCGVFQDVSREDIRAMIQCLRNVLGRIPTE